MTSRTTFANRRTGESFDFEHDGLKYHMSMNL